MPDRSPESVTSWLQQHPFVQVVSRDGFTAYRQAITKANPNIIQIYDRWHFIRNAKKQVDTYINSRIPATITWIVPAEKETELPLRTPERKARERQKQKWTLIQNIQKEYRSGKSLSRIARENQLDRRTVR